LTDFAVDEPLSRSNVTTGLVLLAATVVDVVVVVVVATVVVGATVVVVVVGAVMLIHFVAFGNIAHTSLVPDTLTTLPGTVHLAPSLLAANAGALNTPTRPRASVKEATFLIMAIGYPLSRTQEGDTDADGDDEDCE
jgi:hypothetical protein